MDLNHLLKDYLNLCYAVSILVFSLLLLFCESKLYKYFSRVSDKSRVFYSSLVEAMHRPLSNFILIFSLLQIFHYLTLQFVSLSFSDSAIATGKIIIYNIFILWFLLRFIREAEKSFFRQPKSIRKFNKTTIHGIAQISSVLITVLVVLNIFTPVFGVPATAILAFGGFGGAALALASQDLLSNFFGGFYIFLDRPFDLGDWISSPDKDIEGVVEYIGWRLTRIRTFEKRSRYIPNSTFSKLTLDNASRMTHRKIFFNVGVRYDDASKVSDIIRDIDKMVSNSESIDDTQVHYARFVNFGDSSLDFEIYAFTKETTRAGYLSVQQKLFLNIIDIIASHGAECAFPTRTVYMQNNSSTAEKSDS